MKTINIAEAKRYFDTPIMQSLHEPISVTDEQKEIAVILSPEDFYQLLKAAKRSVSDMKQKTLVDFLGAGKAHSRFSSVEEIDAFVTGNREAKKALIERESAKRLASLGGSELQLETIPRRQTSV